MQPFEWQDRTVLITGGTGSFGRRFVETILKAGPRKVIVFSRDELKQHEMPQRFSDTAPTRDPVLHRRRARRAIGSTGAFNGVDIVVHAAALKQVPAGEYNPFEAIKTNILGAKNVIDAAIDSGVERVVACRPTRRPARSTSTGRPSWCADKTLRRRQRLRGCPRDPLPVVRYGNVVGSRGSVDPVVPQARETGTVTDHRRAHDALLDHARAGRALRHAVR